VKPGNVMIGPDGRAQLFDFGIAATPARSDGGLPAPGMTSGTLPYMAPEQLAGQLADPASDVYALGVVLYEMLAGRRPYVAATTGELAQQQRLPPGPVNDAPAELVDLAMAGLAYDPRARPPASEVARQLRAWLARLAEAQTVFVAAVPQTAVVPGVAADSVRPVGRRPSAIALVAGAIVIVGLMGGSLVLSNGLGHPLSTAVPATVAPTPAPDQPTLGPTQPAANPAPAPAAGGGNQGDNGKHGDNGHGGHGQGHGKGGGD
jgi:serine/threonine-protein kinase